MHNGYLAVLHLVEEGGQLAPAELLSWQQFDRHLVHIIQYRLVGCPKCACTHGGRPVTIKICAMQLHAQTPVPGCMAGRCMPAGVSTPSHLLKQLPLCTAEASTLQPSVCNLPVPSLCGCPSGRRLMTMRPG